MSLPFKLSPLSVGLLGAGVFIVALLIAMVSFQVSYGDRIYPGVSSFGIDIGGMNQAEAVSALDAQFKAYCRQPVELRAGDRRWETSMSDLGLSLDANKTVDAAFTVGRVGNPFERLQDQSRSIIGPPVTIKPILSVDENRKSAATNALISQIDQQVRDSSLTVDKAAGKVRVSSSQVGYKVDIIKSYQTIEQALMYKSGLSFDLSVQEVPPQVNPSDLETARAQAEKMISAPLQLKYEEMSWTISIQNLAEWLTFDKQAGTYVASFAEVPLRDYLETLAKKVDRPGQNARFNRSGGKLSLVRPGVEGLKLDMGATTQLIYQYARSDNRVVPLAVAVTQPAYKSTDIGKLSFPDLIEEASTSYSGSVAERAHNVELAASRLNGVVVGPGETFSFNEELGPVTIANGYKVGWGITMSGTEMATVPSEGGGICQVATTLLHPVFWAGYPIVERLGHLYWIPRYGQPPKGLQGLDATVDTQYDSAGVLVSQVDLKFKNTSPDPILIQTRTDGETLLFMLFGKKPDWKVEVEGPKIEDVVAASDEIVRREDPSLPPGAEMAIEAARDGFKATIVRKVKDVSGKLIQEQTFVSVYRPSRNVILVGAKATPTPTPTPGPGSTVTGTVGATGTKTPVATPVPTGTPKPSSTP